ncbi:type II toxin-antitoxin system HipA family toxin [Corallococcus sp. AB038B]|uniref:type II toxin-antitoxin system HipA family toxin n=1 Tax=Corallococcus sp. AB038B TaxID=2316718 RepID=UPI000EC88D7B|nr:HipA domain-containing protein [Corallococcus sp. AB038B]RKI04027.1 type II toxin-antitoxin system HipA family toxin [Corallococcus sp. AB038B]
MTRPTDVEVAEVWRESTHVGSITRTAHGSFFEYSADFFEQNKAMPGGIAVHLPYSRLRTETLGTNLHTYFAGLLPEGLRMRVLLERTKTSEDDLLSLLMAAGADTVGDLSIIPRGQPLPEPAHQGEKWKPESVLFSDLFAKSLPLTGTESTEPTIPGVQEKISASTISFPVSTSGQSDYILKLNPRDKPELVRNEHFFMGMAKQCGLRVATTRLVHDRDRNDGLLVARFDRSWLKAERRLRRVHQEDACQFLDRYPSDKYRLTCAAIAEGLREHCAAPVPEIARFLQLVAFSYLIGNGDLHAKNVSILADGPDDGFRLSPAYDLLTTLPYGDQRMALKFEGRDDNLRRAYFIAFGERYGVNAKAVSAMLDKMCVSAEPWLERLEEIGFDTRGTTFLRRTMHKRLGELRAA